MSQELGMKTKIYISYYNSQHHTYTHTRTHLYKLEMPEYLYGALIVKPNWLGHSPSLGIVVIFFNT